MEALDLIHIIKGLNQIIWPNMGLFVLLTTGSLINRATCILCFDRCFYRHRENRI